MKCGSPCGRIIDEAGDTMIYTIFAHIYAHATRVPPGWLTLGYALANIPSYMFEISYKSTGIFKNADEFFGPMEMEFLLCWICVFIGYNGPENLHYPTGISFLPEYIQWVHILLGFLLIVMTHFIMESTIDSAKVSIK